MRKGFDEMSGLDMNGMGKVAASGEVYVYLNRTRNALQLLHWEGGGFVVYYSRRDKGTFGRPAGGTASPLIRWPELVLMVEGMQVEKYRQKPRYLLPEKWFFYCPAVSFPGLPGSLWVLVCGFVLRGCVSPPPAPEYQIFTAAVHSPVW